MALMAAVVEQGNFAQAAKVVDLTPAMVGRRIAAIEEKLGFKLFNRSTRWMELTPGGQTYYEGCKRILTEVYELEESVTSSHQTNPKGMIRLTAPDGLGSPFLIDMIHEFRQPYPDVRFDIDLSSEPKDLIAEKIDLSIRLAFELEDSSMIATKLGRTSFALYASEQYLNEKGYPQTLNDLKQHDCLHMGASKYGDFWNVIVAGELTRFRQDWALVLPNTECLIQAVAKGLGIALIPTLLVDTHIKTGRIIQLEGIADFPKLTVYAMYPTRKHLPYRVNLFLDFLKDNAPKLLAS